MINLVNNTLQTFLKEIKFNEVLVFDYNNDLTNITLTTDCDIDLIQTNPISLTNFAQIKVNSFEKYYKKRAHLRYSHYDLIVFLGINPQDDVYYGASYLQKHKQLIIINRKDSPFYEFTYHKIIELLKNKTLKSTFEENDEFQILTIKE